MPHCCLTRLFSNLLVSPFLHPFRQVGPVLPPRAADPDAGAAFASAGQASAGADHSDMPGLGAPAEDEEEESAIQQVEHPEWQQHI